MRVSEQVDVLKLQGQHNMIPGALCEYRIRTHILSRPMMMLANVTASKVCASMAQESRISFCESDLTSLDAVQKLPNTKCHFSTTKQCLQGILSRRSGGQEVGRQMDRYQIFSPPTSPLQLSPLVPLFSQLQFQPHVSIT